MHFEEMSSLVIFVLDLKATNSISVLESEGNNINPGFLEYQVLWQLVLWSNQIKQGTMN